MAPWLLLLAILVLVSMLVLLRHTRQKPLAVRVSSLGELRGRSMASIISVLGQPDEVTRYADDRRIMAWQTPTYQIALVASPDNICGGAHMERTGKAAARQGGGQLSVGFSAWTEI